MLDDLKNFRVFLLFSACYLDQDVYSGLTTDKTEAYKHFMSNPGYVVVVTKDTYKVIQYVEQWMDIL